MPVTRHALERRRPAVLEADSRSGHQVLHGAGHEHLTGTRQGRYPSPDMNSDTAYLFADKLAFTGVNATTDIEVESTQAVTNGGRAADGAGGAIEGGIPNRAARSEPTASITARTSSIRCSSVGISAARSDRPVPRLSKQMTRFAVFNRSLRCAES
jgi:hypothetical protein